MKKDREKTSDKKSFAGMPTPSIGSGPGSERNEFKLSRLDYIIAPVVAVLAGVWIFLHIGTAINWDDLLYMSLSRHTVPQAWILNRYGHIYFMKFFVLLTGDTIVGAKVFWCFLFSGTCVLTYWCARILGGSKAIVTGVIAVLFVCMQHVFGKDPGCALPDFTVMFFAALGTFVYLAFLKNRSKYSHLIIMLLGLIFFWAVKSKESGICLGVLFLGLGQDESGVRSIKRFAGDIGWAFSGVVLGGVLLMFMDLIFMGDFLFSVRPANIKAILSSNIHGPSASAVAQRISVSWFTFFTTRPIFVPFLLYLLVGWWSPTRKFSFREKIAWIFPLVLMVFLRYIRTGFYIIPRYFTPAIPIVSIWAAQFFAFDFSGQPLRWENRYSVPRRAVSLFLVLVSLIIAGVFVYKIPEMTEYYKLNGLVTGFHDLKYNRLNGEQIFYMLVTIPTFLTALLIVGVMSKKRGLPTLFFSSLCLFVLVLSPLTGNISLLQKGDVARRSEWRFEPFRVFKDEIQFAKGDKIVISKDIHPRSWMLGRRAKAHCHMLNIYFNAHFDYDEVVDGGIEDILKADYAYAFITAKDWNDIKQKHNAEFLLNSYELKTDQNAVFRTRTGQMQLILLKKR